MLKSLELFGFKSFADRTTFDFSRGVTAVVGPNGSGKSNVVDAIKWILGDQSAKSLRGKEMTDVIFNGASNRKGAAVAEATLAFDNSSGFLPVEHSEVHIGRRLWRSGESEYLLNGNPVRLKDVRQLLMGSDAGSAAYSIIEQGRVDQILQANAVSRRAIFEEAAGINLYQARRAEFVRRMERVDQTLDRLTDIVDEVEVRRTALKSQAEKAAKFREVSTELRTRWLGLAADDYRLYAERIERLSEQNARDQSQLEAIESRRSALERKLEEVDHESAEVDRRLRDKDREISGLRESVAGRMSTIRLQSGRREEFESELLRLKRQRALLETRHREGRRELDETSAALRQGEAACRELTDGLQSLEAQIARQDEELQQQRDDERQQVRDVDDARQRLAEARQEVANLKTQVESADGGRRSAEHRLAEVERKLVECSRQCNAAEQTVATIVERVQAAQRRHGDVSETQSRWRTERDRLQTVLGELREKRSADQARLAVLQDLEARQEGLGIGVKEILRRAKTSEYPPWNGIAGTVADLIEVDLEHAALLEAALGERAQQIVLHDFAPLVEYLNVHSSQISGRVAFRQRETDGADETHTPTHPTSDSRRQPSVLVPKASTVDSSLPDLQHEPGVVDRADRLVRAADGFERLPEQVLADTWIVETLDVALRLAAIHQGRFRFATLQGEVLEPDGALIAGSLRSDTAVVSRKSELRQLKNDLIRLDHRIVEEERRLNDAAAQLDGAIGELNRSSEELQQLNAEHADAKSELTAHQRERDRLRKEGEMLESEISGLKGVQSSLTEEAERREMQLQDGERLLQQQQDAVEQIRQEIAGLDEQRKEVERRRDAQQLELAKQEERCDGLRESFKRARRDQETRLQQRQESRRRLTSLQVKLRDVELAILETRAILAELSLAEQRCGDEAESVSAEKDDVRARRAGLTREDGELRRELLKLQERMHRNELDFREARQSCETLTERIAEEFQVELADVVQTGVSAYRDWLKEAGRQRPEVDGSETGGPEAELGVQGADEHDGTGNARSDDDDASPRARSAVDESAVDVPSFDEVRDQLEAQVERLRRKRKAMGAVNADSLRDLDEIESRFEYLSMTLEDLLEAKKHLEELVRRIDAKCREMFCETFDVIRENFRELFRKAFGGGDGDIVLEDPDDVLECGIDIVARPPGKELKSITLLSGGEKTLTAFALLLALFRYRPSPYCILDEVDAALDEANVERLLALLQEFKVETQFLLITHKKPTMTIADVLYGVTMEESGVSKRLNVRFENIGEDGEFLSGGPSAAA